MKCNNCGYNSLKDFTVCPYCDKPLDIIVNPAYNNSNIYNNDSQINLPLQNSSKKIPKGYSQIQSGFKFTQCVKDGEFYDSVVIQNDVKIEDYEEVEDTRPQPGDEKPEPMQNDK